MSEELWFIMMALPDDKKKKKRKLERMR